MDARQVKDALLSRAAEVCQHLIPDGRVLGHEFVAGTIQGGPGQSFRVALRGSKAGVWADFADPGCKGGNLLDLWMNVRGVPFVEALKQAKTWMGIPDSPDRPSQNTVRRLAREVVGGSALVRPDAAGAGRKELTFRRAERDGKVWRWLTGRGVQPAAIEAYKVGDEEFEVGGKMRTFAVFPFYDARGNLVRLKYRDIVDKSCMFQKPKVDEASRYVHGSVRLLWGWQAVEHGDTEVVITEGEVDALTVFGEGMKALSLPEGAQVKGPGDELSESHKAWLEHDYEALDQFDSVLMCLDMDEPGKKAAAVLAPRLGAHRVKMVSFERAKDANEALATGELEFALASAEDLRPADLKRPTEFRDAIWNEFFPSDQKKGYGTPWAMRFNFLPGQLTIWHGYNGSGKTVCMSYSMMHMAHRHSLRVCVASMEMSAAKTFKNALRQAIGHGHPWGNDEAERRGVFDVALRWLDDRFLVFDRLGEVAVEDVLAVFEYAFRRYGASHFVLDSLMMLKGQGEEDSRLYSNQREVVKRLKDFAMRWGVHVHLVAHSKKPDSKKNASKSWPSKFDISGSGNLSNIADNVVCVWRHEAKEEKIREAGEMLRDSEIQRDPDDKSKYETQINVWKKREDAMFIVQKQRETGELPCKRLYFDFGDDGSWQYLEEMDKRGMVRCYVPELAAGFEVAHGRRKWHEERPGARAQASMVFEKDDEED